MRLIFKRGKTESQCQIIYLLWLFCFELSKGKQQTGSSDKQQQHNKYSDKLYCDIYQLEFAKFTRKSKIVSCQSGVSSIKVISEGIYQRITCFLEISTKDLRYMIPKD